MADITHEVSAELIDADTLDWKNVQLDLVVTIKVFRQPFFGRRVETSSDTKYISILHTNDGYFLIHGDKIGKNRYDRSIPVDGRCLECRKIRRLFTEHKARIDAQKLLDRRLKKKV